MTIEYDYGAELPTERLTLKASDGTVPDLTVYATIELRIGKKGKPAYVTKTLDDGLTAGATAPNLIVAFEPDDLTFSPNRKLTWTIECRDGSDHDRIFQDDFILNDVVRNVLGS